jgi:Novel Ras effector 1 C-terminal SARAH (Sav/Rassf/Hpo) domain
MLQQWEAFSIPELNNFLVFLQREEEEQVREIRLRYAELHQHIEKRLQCLAPQTAN